MQHSNNYALSLNMCQITAEGFTWCQYQNIHVILCSLFLMHVPLLATKKKKEKKTNIAPY